jgi:hypothetical protein
LEETVNVLTEARLVTPATYCANDKDATLRRGVTGNKTSLRQVQEAMRFDAGGAIEVVAGDR